MTTFDIAMEPTGKGRHRTIRNGPRAGHTYTPAKTTAAAEQVAAAFRATHAEPIADGVPVLLSVHAMFVVPKSASKKRRVSLMGTPCLKKPDGDNILKLVSDALNGIAYHDDSQVAVATVTKRWSFASRVTVRVEAL